MDNESSLVVHAFLRLQWASRYFLALVFGIAFEKVLDVNADHWVLFALIVVFGLLSIPWQHLPFIRVRLFGVPIHVGFVDSDGSEQDEPSAWGVSTARLNQRAELVTSGEYGFRILEVEAKYRVIFCDDTGTTAIWREVGCFNGRRRYVTICFGNSQSRRGEGTVPVPLREQIIVERVLL